MARAWWVAWAPSPWPGRWLTPVGPRAGAQARCWWWCSRATPERPGPRLAPVPRTFPTRVPTWAQAGHLACKWSQSRSVHMGIVTKRAAY